MEIGYKLYEDFSEEGREAFEKAQLEMALLCDANGWCMEDGYDEDGKRYLIINPPEPEYVPTEEEKQAQLQKQMTDAVQRALDAFAKTRGYDGIMSACSYSNSTDAQFKLEADYCIQLRDTTWRMGYAILAEVKAGNRPVPTVEELIAELPVGSAKWPDEQ